MKKIKNKVLLTGISGYIGLHCAVELLKNGYVVKGSLRDLSKSKKIKSDISKFINSKDNLEFCELDLLSDKGWDDAAKDCEYIMHVASPFINYEPKDKSLYIKPAVDGTLRALNSGLKANIKRIIITSSVVAMIKNGDKSTEINEHSWTNINAKNISAYAKSKTLAEKKAWKFVKEHNMELVVINPGPVFGPPISNNLSGASMSMFKDLITGKIPMIPQSSINMSDVRDVAKVHVLALKNKKAPGNRFIVTTKKSYSFSKLAQLLKINGYSKVSTKIAPNFLLKFLSFFDREARSMRAFIGKKYDADISKTMKIFNWTHIPFEKTILDTAKYIEKVIK